MRPACFISRNVRSWVSVSRRLCTAIRSSLLVRYFLNDSSICLIPSSRPTLRRLTLVARNSESRMLETFDHLADHRFGGAVRRRAVNNFAAQRLKLADRFPKRRLLRLG